MPADAGLTHRPRLVRRAVAVLASGCAVLATAACGPLPPQAPVAQASTISSALTTISASCGESYRLQEFTVQPDLSGLESTAAHSAATLARIGARHPQWVYQDRTLAQIETLSAAALRSCSLTRAAGVLQAAGAR